MMARDILFPTHLDALVVPAGTTSPTANLSAGALFADGAPLGPGIHLHWALPDPLTQADGPSAAKKTLTFPAVPDLWLVIRIAPPPGGTVVGPSGVTPRPTKAWVIDSAAVNAYELESWIPPTPPSGPFAIVASIARPRLTAMGPLASGLLAADDKTGEARAVPAVYYPMSANRFGFHDTLDGVAAGAISYLVVGWYADATRDPMNVDAAAQAAWLTARQVVVEDKGSTPRAVTTPIASGAPTSSTPAAQASWLTELVARFKIKAAPSGVAPATVTIAARSGDRLICHGAITGVPWKKPPPSVTPLQAGARLYGSLYEAAERYFADLFEEAWMRDAVSALLARAGGHSASFLDAAWRGHQAGFASHLGESKPTPQGASETAPRFHAPDAPAVLIDGLPRSPRHGEDADLDLQRRPGQPGFVRCRVWRPTSTGATVTALAPSSDLSIDADDMASAVIDNRLPRITNALLSETMLLDDGNLAAITWKVSTARGVSIDEQSVTSAAVRAVAAWRQLRDPSPEKRADAQPYFVGTPPATYAVKPWRPTPLPLYAEIEGRVAADSEVGGTDVLPGSWTLGTIDLERRPDRPPATLGSEKQFRLRRALTPVVARMLGTVTVSDEVRAMALLGCSLPEVDAALPPGATVRSGRLTITKLRVIDTFGMAYDVVTPSTQPWLDLTPRLAGWARLHARLRDRADPQRDAEDGKTSPVCGFVLADRVDHALEIFDADGARVGQVRDDRAGDARRVVWEPDPFRAAVDASKPATDPARVLRAADPDGVLLAIVRGLIDAQAAYRDTHPGIRDTSVSALVGALDTLQPTAERTTAGDEIGPLLGRPLAVVRIAASMERVAPGVADPRSGPRVAETGAPDAIKLLLAFGAVTRADDGVFGYFAGGTFACFHPVDPAAISPDPSTAIDHPYALASPVLQLAGGATELVTLLVDPRLTIHVRTGLLPAKRITLPPAMYQAALRRLAPSIRVGPVLLPPSRPWLPTPCIPDGTWRWLHVRPGESAGPPVEEALVTPGAGEHLADESPVAQHGWLRLVPNAPTKPG